MLLLLYPYDIWGYDSVSPVYDYAGVKRYYEEDDIVALLWWFNGC